VRQSLRRHLGSAYLAPAHWRALRTIFATPRLYDRFQTVVDPFTGRRLAIDEIQAALAGSGGLNESTRTRGSFPST
jgi:hypothetical protein